MNTSHSNPVDEWLAAFPSEAVDQRIVEIEAELTTLRMAVAARGGPPKPRSYRGSYREMIIALLRDRPGLSPAEIRRTLGVGASENAVQTTLSRMARAGQVIRSRHATYTVG